MNEVWRDMSADFLASYRAIEVLANNGYMDEEERAVYEHNLLHDIVETFISEVED